MSSEKFIKKSTKDTVFEELKKLLEEPKQDSIWQEKFKSKVRELLN